MSLVEDIGYILETAEVRVYICLLSEGSDSEGLGKVYLLGYRYLSVVRCRQSEYL